ncbi:hypothetical protein BO78DRAFT_49072 [Aspergillus sclerotiicarbonarius CBS 121057]|uniref:Uncharacterized protein n=1 Tax=Aspergillus sclerotiicarbonarius (strain CBS 121057 / IBT 28362) TaxID=1448318 RepID=A0A319FL69_ASPSB|nr:hypothetical protein BO78DRAFT_49072 [Aspergillus sclerotiicarbonarius CBS 121057]
MHFGYVPIYLVLLYLGTPAQGTRRPPPRCWRHGSPPPLSFCVSALIGTDDSGGGTVCS